MIGHQERVVMLYQGSHRVSQLVSRRSSIAGERNAPECQYHFTQYRLIDCQAGDGKRSSMRRMRMTNRLHIRPLVIDQEMHRQLARSAVIAERLARNVRD